jgi:multimeric flavodoxin WrbA
MASFLKGAQAAGAQARVLAVAGKSIEGCRACGDCYRTGQCVIDDDMEPFYQALEAAARIVLVTPVYFYGIPALGKAMIDRAQVFWSRIYKLGQKREFAAEPRGLVLAVGATKGKDLFTPIHLSMKYFFDSVGFPRKFPFVGFRRIEEPSDWAADQLAQVEGYGQEFVRGQLDLTLL